MFELVEWIYAELANPSAGAAFLGSQGDIWDAQKDMLCDGSGAVFSTVLYALFYRGKTLNESDLNR
jgi:putative membrane protein